MKFSATKLLVLGLTVALAACQDTSSPTDQVAPPSFAAAKKTPLTGTPTERAAQIAAKVNARLAARGSKYPADRGQLLHRREGRSARSAPIGPGSSGRRAI